MHNGTSVSGLRATSLFSWSFKQNARDTQMTTRVSFLASTLAFACTPLTEMLAVSAWGRGRSIYRALIGPELKITPRGRGAISLLASVILVMENFQRKWTSKTGNVIVKNKSNTIFLFPMIHTPIDVKMFKTLKWNHEPQESGSTWVLTSSLRSIRVQTMENCCRCLMEHESAC